MTQVRSIMSAQEKIADLEENEDSRVAWAEMRDGLDDDENPTTRNRIIPSVDFLNSMMRSLN